ncbi:beta-galactosidase [Wenyingzhuangia heitensis]|uniref:Beta-galactosidase n=1 Tax=Wenyingzhuangia heitensis TaxID=1487859 RepID=A0ABX0UBK4_9FLAO|nr:beta-galactosidase [Wenyingzhuangia heitensis]NIJ46215.1 beta-galactosidase [Wenyingzhuangia heitensis]
MKIKFKNIKRIVSLFLIITNVVSSQTTEKQVGLKIKELENLVKELDKENIDSYKERMTIFLAKTFLGYANWDEKHIALNTDNFKKVRVYKNKAEQMAKDLPDFERKDVALMLDNAIKTATALSEKEIFRKPYQEINWSKIKHDKNELTYKGKPVFLSDYTWKPEVKELNKFFGELDGVYIAPTQLKASGVVNPATINQIKNKDKGTAGFVFIAHTPPSKWTLKEYGDDFLTYGGQPFTHYDIDNPGARKMMSELLEKTVPYMVDKNYTQLGYMLANEPRWITYKNQNKKVWYTGGVSHYTKAKFKTWLKNKHKNITALNKLWKTNFSDFEDVSIEIPIDISLMGTSKWYDWTTFNEDRVTDWFTYLKQELRKNDPTAKAHLKIMPSFFTDNDPCTGIDLEALTELSDINGNDVAAHYNNIRETADWEGDYMFGWRELYMGYDFLKSVKPDQINFNSESHLLSTSSTRDLYMNPKYARAVYWAAYTLGLNAVQTWYWPRREDGSLRGKMTNAYGGSNNQQPRVTQELQNTIIDLNTFSEEITAMQHQRKPIRIFYSKTSANQESTYMDGIFDLYESLNFEGLPLGFATKNIINKQANKNWDVILVYKTAQVTQDELDALQMYLDNGGKVIVDSVSLKKNEYGLPLQILKESKGTLVTLTSLDQVKSKALFTVQKELPNLTITEVGNVGKKKCTWRVVKNKKGNDVLSVINLGREDVELKIRYKKNPKNILCKDLIKGVKVSSSPVLAPYEVFFVEVQSN